MAQNQTLPLGSGLGAIRARSLQGDANEAAFRKDASSGGILSKLLGMYPTQSEAIDARKAGQARISDILGGLMGGGASSSEPMFMPDESSGMNIDGSEPTQTPFYIGEAARDIGGQLVKDFRGAGRMVTDAERSILQGLFTGPNIKRGRDLYGGDFDVTGGSLDFDEEFGGTIPRATEEIFDEFGNIAPDGTMPKQTEITSVADDLAAMAGAEAREADETSPMTLMAEAEAQEGDEASKEAVKRVTDRSQDPFESALAEAMKSYEDAKAGEDTGTKDIDYYKKQFAEATGIDPSGKVDKSQALMAFGLALMQNKAGKGFDVGKMLSAVGAAGEAAMPALEKAEDRAAAGKLAAGKFALQQLDSDEKRQYESLIRQEDRIAELKKASASAASDRALEITKHANAMEKARLETRAEVEAASIKAGADLTKLQFDFTGEKTREPLTSKPNIKMHIANRKSDGREIFTKPSTDVDLIAKGYADALDGTASIDNMIDLVTSAANQFQGGLAGSQLVAFLDNKLSAFGIDMNINYETGKKLPPVTELRAIKDRIIAQYKRFLTQETGNGISNTDVERLAKSLGEVDFFTNPQEAIKRLQETRLIFTSSEDALKGALLSYTDKSKYLDPTAYDEVQAQINKSAFGAAGLGKGAIPTFKNKDGVTVIKLS